MAPIRPKILFAAFVVACSFAALAFWPTPFRLAKQKLESLGGTLIENTEGEGPASRLYRTALFRNGSAFDADLALLRDLRPLQAVILSANPISDAGLVHLEKLEELERIELIRTSITDRGLSHLAKLRNLRMINLHATNVTDVGLENLRDLAVLECVDATETRITPRGVARLREAIPSLKTFYLFAADDD